MGVFNSSCSKNDNLLGISSELSSLPRVTGPVSTSAITAGVFPAGKIISGLASNGVILGQLESNTFSGKSNFICAAANNLSQILREASQPEKIQCYLGTMESAGMMNGVNLTSGEYIYMKLKNMGDTEEGEATEPVIKMKLVKENGRIRTFEMFSCFASLSGNNEYVLQEFTGTGDSRTGSIISKYVGTEGTASFGSLTSVNGNYNFLTGAWESKTFSGTRTYSDSGDSSTFSQLLTAEQYSDYITLSGAERSIFGGNLALNTFYSASQLINADDLSTLAIGDTSMRANFSYDQGNDASPEFTASGYYSINGDSLTDLGTASDGDFYDEVDGATLPSAATGSETVVLDSSQQWDCTLPSGASWVNLDFSTEPANFISEMDVTCGGIESEWAQCDY